MANECVFCWIVNGTSPATIVYQDDNYLAFKDLYPKSDEHLLVIPKEHIQDASKLNQSNSYKVQEMLDIGHELILNIGGSVSDCRFGFHWPPFNSIKHLHLHVIYPVKNMSSLAKVIYKPSSFYFATPEETIKWANKQKP